MQTVVVTAADKNYKDILTKAIELSPYEYIVNDLGGLGFGERQELAQTSGAAICLAKPRFMREAHRLIRLGGQRPLLWADADCIILEELPELENGDFDVAIRVRNFGAQPLQAGVVFMKGNTASDLFLSDWLDRQPKVPAGPSAFRFGDQRYLNQYVCESFTPRAEMAGEVHVLNNGVRLKLLDRRYNDYESPESGKYLEDSKILHFKSGGKGRDSFNVWLSSNCC